MKGRPWGALVVGALSAILVSSTGIVTVPAVGVVAAPDAAEAGISSAAGPFPPVHVTVTIESVSPLVDGLDLSIIDAEVIIDQEDFVGAPAFPASIGDTIYPGWRFRKQVDPARAVFEDSIPIRIRVHGSSPQLQVGHLPVDVDPYECGQCLFIDSGRPSSDERGLDLWLNLVTGGIRQNGMSWGGGTGPWCAEGTSFFAAKICFNVTRSHFTVPDYDSLESYDGRCHLNDCSLFEAVRDAGTPSTELYLPAGDYSLDEPLQFKTPAVTVTGLPGGVIIRQPAVGERVVEVEQQDPRTGRDVYWERPVILRGLTLYAGYSGNAGLRGHFHGGGVHNHGWLELRNVTITGNFAPRNRDDATGRGGGGVYNANKATLRNVTIAGNLATNDGAGLSGAIGSETRVQNTLVVHNLGGDGNCTVDDDGQVDFPIIDLGGNLEYPGDTCGPAFGNAAQDPALALEANLGPARTWPLVPGGPAVDAGVFGDTATELCFPDRDQLDVARPQPGSTGAPARCDSGALELQLAVNTAPLVAIQPPITGYRTTEGTPLQVKAVTSDATRDRLTYAWSPPANFDDPTSPIPRFVATVEGVYPIEVRVTDGELTATAASVVTVDNIAPSIESLTVTPDAAVSAGTQVIMTATIADPGLTDTQTCTFTWDEPGSAGPTVVTGVGTGALRTCSAGHSFSSAGEYQVVMTVDDGDGGQASESTLVVVPDPTAGGITGTRHLGWWLIALLLIAALAAVLVMRIRRNRSSGTEGPDA